MDWNTQRGGPWGGGGGGGGQGPWGGGSGGGGGQGPGGGMQPPDVEEALRRAQEKLKSFMPGSGGSGKGIILVCFAVVAIWFASGFYRVQPDEQGVQLLFGKFVSETTPGLNYWFPSPIGTVYTPNVTRVNTTQIGYRGGEGTTTKRDVPSESLMLTGDQNVIDIDFDIQWQIKGAANYLFNIRDPEGTIKIAAESALREVVGQSDLEAALVSGRQQIEAQTQELLQGILDSYGAGILITQTKLLESDPPQEVIDAFNDVQRAKQDQERAVNEANTYKNDIVPRAKGEAEKRTAAANAYKEQVTKEAEGEAARFLSVYETYKTNKDVTTQRLFLERMEDVLSRSNKIIIDNEAGGSGVVPYLPLNELQKRSGGTQ